MGFDEWMLSQAAASPQSLYWRLYTWKTGTITFGFNQRQETAYDHGKLGETPVIRRITGGRAVFHDTSELTYSVAFNSTSPICPELGISPAKSSEFVAQVLAEFLHRLGVSAQWVKKSSPDNAKADFFHKAACFASHAKYELTANGRKIVASARRDWNGGVLQHGSIKLHGLKCHPALFEVVADDHVSTKSIDVPELTAFVAELSCAIESRLQMRIPSIEPTIEQQAEIALFAERVRRNARDKRELFAQIASTKSP